MMAAQAMGSRGAGGGQPPPPPLLPRQGSVYNLTLNEVQHHLGEPLLSMNLDDLLRNVLPPPEPDPDGPGGSSAVARSLTKKTVDEVWKDIQRDEDPGSLGEMTLEDFLVKAGIVAEGWDDENVGKLHWLQQYQQACLRQQSQQPPSGVCSGGYGLSQMPMPMPLQAVPDQMGIPCSPAHGTMSDSPAGGRKRTATSVVVHGDVVEKTVERRQKRMIKNRESAARSRARKQAYTNELENKVSRLEVENELLKKQQELDRILYSMPIPEPKFQLRRTSSAPL